MATSKKARRTSGKTSAKTKAKAKPKATQAKPKVKPKAKPKANPKATTAPAKRKAPTGKPKPVGARTPGGRVREPKASRVRKPIVKPARPAPARRPARRSQHPEAVRSRKRRALAREAERQKEIERKRRALAKKQKARTRKRRVVDEAELARDWLEMIRLRIAEVFDVSLEVTFAGGGAARSEDRERQEAAAGAGNPWMIVGHFTPEDEINYQALAVALGIVEDDLVIEAAVHPSRLSQIRIIFHDPLSKRGEGNDVLSHIGAWSFVLGDAIGDLVGADATDPTEGSLAARYAETTVPSFYIFFSRTIVEYRTAWPSGARTQEVKLR